METQEKRQAAETEELQSPPAQAQGSSAEETQREDPELAALRREYPQAVQNGAVALPPEVAALQSEGMSLLAAFRLHDLRKTKEENTRLTALYEAEKANRANEAAAIGSVAGGEAMEKDYYSSQEWDRLPRRLRDKFIKSGKIFEFMKKWSDEK